MRSMEWLPVALTMVFCAQGVAQDELSPPDEPTESEYEYLYSSEEWAALTESDPSETDGEEVAEGEESAMPGEVSALDPSTSMESVREQGGSFFDTEGSLVIDAESFESIENGYFPIPEVPEPTLVEDTEEE